MSTDPLRLKATCVSCIHFKQVFVGRVPGMPRGSNPAQFGRCDDPAEHASHLIRRETDWCENHKLKHTQTLDPFSAQSVVQAPTTEQSVVYADEQPATNEGAEKDTTESGSKSGI